MPLFSLNQHQLHYGEQRIWENLNLCIETGEKVAIVGPSGAGKTSLLHVLYQQHPEQIALCPQELGLVDSLSVYHNIYMGRLSRHAFWYNLWNLARPFAHHKTAIGQLTEQLGVEDKLFHSVDQLSGGQRQRVAVGRALYREQPTFLGDEPVSNLDPLQAQLVLELIIARHETAVVALHNRQLALSVFDRIIGLRDGAIQFDQPATQVDAAQLNAFYGDGQS
jgi:phosphonate transport system ATP-binding protein